MCTVCRMLCFYCDWMCKRNTKVKYTHICVQWTSEVKEIIKGKKTKDDDDYEFSCVIYLYDIWYLYSIHDKSTCAACEIGLRRDRGHITSKKKPFDNKDITLAVFCCLSTSKFNDLEFGIGILIQIGTGKRKTEQIRISRFFFGQF